MGEKKAGSLFSEVIIHIIVERYVTRIYIHGHQSNNP